jgi:YjbE family integral membrane protein
MDVSRREVAPTRAKTLSPGRRRSVSRQYVAAPPASGSLDTPQIGDVSGKTFSNHTCWSIHTMEFLSAPWWSALLTIILIDLVLAGDNAIVIALAARSLPKEHQKKAIIWGTVGAIVVRSVMTVGVVWLLKIPGLMLVGGLALLWIAYRLIAENDGDEDEHGPAATTFWGAMKTIVIADAIMGIDNVLGVAGAAHGAFDLVVLGLLISIPIVVFGSTLVLKLVERFPAIMYIGAAVLAFTAGKMIVNEKLAVHIFKSPAPELAANAWYWAVVLLSIVGVLSAGWLHNRRMATRPDSEKADAA